MKTYDLIKPEELNALALTANDLYVCRNHTGKMDGMMSISTSCQLNPFCVIRNKTRGTVCYKCFSFKQTRRYINQENLLRKNWFLLTTTILPYEEIPVINGAFVRLEAFGDVNNTIQVINYFNICKKNPFTRFVLWSKNLNIINRVIKTGVCKPDNLFIIQSSYRLNIQEKPMFDFVDAVFTVYDKKFIAENGVDINCGARHCLSCLKCYTLEHGQVVYINEELK